MARAWISALVGESVKKKKQKKKLHIKISKSKEMWYNYQLVRDNLQGGATI